MKFKILILLLFISPLLLAQSTKRQYVGLAIGPSFPSGDFAATNLNDSTSGWAKTGVAINLNYSYRFTHNIGVYVIGIFNSNKFDNIKYKDALGTGHQDTTFSVESTRNWSGGGLLIGPYLRIPLSDNFSWDIRGAFGFYSGYSPKLTIRSSASEEAYYRETGSAFGYAYSFGTGFKFKLANYYVLLFGDYLTTPLKFNNVSGWDWDQEPYTAKFKQNISYVNVTIGIGYYF